MSPRSVVQPLEGDRKLEAGVVHAVTKNRLGEVTSVTVKFDVDGALETFAPGELRVLLAH